MFTVPDTDTQIGVVIGPDIGNDAAGSATKWLTAFQTWAGWKARPMGGSYLYPQYDNSQWALKVYQGAGPMCWGSMVVPIDVAAKWTVAKKPSASEITALMTLVRSGGLDKRWSDLAALMVSLGHTTGIYRTGFEGNGNNFVASAGQIGDANYAEIMSRHISVMRAVPGWDFNVEWNYTVRSATQNGLNPDKAWVSGSGLINTVGFDIYAAGGYTLQGWTSANHDQIWKNELLPTLEAQMAFAEKRGLRMGITEFGPIWKSDGHGEGDDRYFLDHLYGWIMANVPAWAFLFNGSNLPGDEARVAKPGAVGTFTFTDNERMKINAAGAVKELFDPSLFVSKSSSPTRKVAALNGQITSLKSQLAAQTNPVAPATPQATIDAAVAAAVVPLQKQLTALQQQMTTTQTALADAVAHAAQDDVQVTTLQQQLATTTSGLNSANVQVGMLQATISKVKADLG
jgi:hypothetical protein